MSSLNDALNNWWTDILVFLAVLFYVVTSWVDWNTMYNTYSVRDWPRTTQYIFGCMLVVLIVLFALTFVLYPY